MSNKFENDKKTDMRNGEFDQNKKPFVKKRPQGEAGSFSSTGKKFTSEGKSFSKDADGGRKDRPFKQSVAEEVIGIDKTIISLLTKRSKLITRLRGGKPYASTPSSIKSEKAIRKHWEEVVSQVSRDARFSRNLFDLVQDIAAQQPAEDQAPRSAYNLAPARLPLNVYIPGPAFTENARLWLALASSLGIPLRVECLQRNQAMIDFVKAFTQSGSSFSWSKTQDSSLYSLLKDSLDLKAKDPSARAERSIFVGEDALTFYLLVFLSLTTTQKLRFSGEHALKKADLTPLYRLLPQLGARLAFAVPGTRGLPAVLESSGILPDKLTIPADLPLEAVMALLLSGFAWQKKIDLDISELPCHIADKALSLLRVFFDTFPEIGEHHATSIRFMPHTAEGSSNNASGKVELDKSFTDNFPEFIRMSLDPNVSAYLAAMPFFAGGNVKLTGSLAKITESDIMFSFLLQALQIEKDSEGLKSSTDQSKVFSNGISTELLQSELHPLFWALNARVALQFQNGFTLAQYPASANIELASNFLTQLGVNLVQEDDKIHLAPMDIEEAKDAAQGYGWSSPDGYWTMAYALGAFIRPNIRLTNPDSATDLMPGFWAIYNALPEPNLKGQPESHEEEAKPRRIRTKTVLDPDDLDELVSYTTNLKDL